MSKAALTHNSPLLTRRTLFVAGTAARCGVPAAAPAAPALPRDAFLGRNVALLYCEWERAFRAMHPRAHLFPMFWPGPEDQVAAVEAGLRDGGADIAARASAVLAALGLAR